jgi:hypothetical protein
MGNKPSEFRKYFRLASLLGVLPLLSVELATIDSHSIFVFVGGILINCWILCSIMLLDWASRNTDQ